jgi:hypothetical protein
MGYVCDKLILISHLDSSNVSCGNKNKHLRKETYTYKLTVIYRELLLTISIAN